MVRTQIILPKSGVVDLYDDVNVSYNFNAADIREPEKGVADYTKTIVLPGTKNNHQLFKNQFDVTIDSVWDTRKKLSCIVICDDIVIMKGYLRLMKIIQRGNNDYDYEVTVIGNAASIFKDVGGDELTVLNLAGLDHNYNKTNIVASWTPATYGEGYVYPYMDNGNFPTNESSLDVHHFLPAIYAKEYIDRIFDHYGYQYESTFFDSAFFKRLIIPFNSEALRQTEATINNREVRVSREGSDQSFTINDTAGISVDVELNDETTAPNTDDSGQYDNVTDFAITVANKGEYILSATFTIEVDFTANISPAYEELSISLKAEILDELDNPVNSVYVNKYVTSSTAHTETIVLNFQSGIIPAGANYYIDIFLYYEATVAAATAARIKTGSWFRMQSTGSIVPGDTMTIGSAIPQRVKISDFLAGIKKLFNLYFSIDKDTTNKYIIEPRDDWYSNTAVDWSDKLDISKDVETVPMGELDSKRYILQYKRDEDYYNSLYQEKFQENYGTRKVNVDTDFVKNDYIIEPVFSASPLHSSTQSDRVYVKVRKKDGTAPTPPANLIKTNIKILYYGGLKSCSTQWEFPKATGFLSTYPFAGHLDDPINPNIDLCYGVPKEVYYRAVQLGCTYTNNNLYNVYWRNLIDEISDKNSRIITAYFNLTPADINQLDARKKYYFKGTYWRLNKIMDYNPLNNSTTKCEFTKIKTSETGFN